MEMFEFDGYSIPTDLVFMTGGGPDTFRSISDWHIALLKSHIGLRSGMKVVEIGCGIGRDAIPLVSILGEQGSYYGTDVIERSVNWCKDNIGVRHKNFKFDWHNIFDSLHNPTGTKESINIRLDVPDNSVDLIILQSVFTHMFEGEIIHYLREFKRILAPGGRVWASVFIVDEAIRNSVAETAPTQYSLSFKIPYGYGCYINGLDSPRGAVAFDQKAIDRMLHLGGLSLVRKPLVGSWSGMHENPEFGQDVLIMERAS